MHLRAPLAPRGVVDRDPLCDVPQARLRGLPANRLSGDQWIIPVLMKVARETIGFDIAIQFERAFPGPVAPVPDPGQPRGMRAADKYLSGSPLQLSP